MANMPVTPPPRQTTTNPYQLDPADISPTVVGHNANSYTGSNDPFVGGGGGETLRNLNLAGCIPALQRVIVPLRDEVAHLLLLAAQDIDPRIKQIIRGSVGRTVEQIDALERDIEYLRVMIFGPLPVPRNWWYRD